MKFTNLRVELIEIHWHQSVSGHWDLPPEPSEALPLTAPKIYRGAYQCNILEKLNRYTISLKKKEWKQILSTIYFHTYLPHFGEANQVGHDHNKQSFLVRSQGAVTDCNIDTSNIMKENEYNDQPRITWRIPICNEMTQNIKKYVPPNIMKNTYKNHMQKHNANPHKLYSDGFKLE